MLARFSVVRHTARAAIARFHTAAVSQEASQFTMPALSPTMTEGNIGQWQVKEGESFSAGDLLLQIETDKAQMDVEAQDDGVMVKILAPDGSQGIKVNSPIAILAEDGDDISSIDISKISSQAAPASSESAAAEPAAAPAAPAAPAVSSEPTPAVEATHTDNSASGVFSPAAEYTVHANHISNASEIIGTGPKGRILKGDVLNFLKNGKVVAGKSEAAPAAPAASSAPAAPVAAKKPAAASSQSTVDSETTYLVQSLEASALRYNAELEMAKKSTIVQIPAEKLSKLIKANKALTETAFAIRAAALALHQVPVAKDNNSRVGIAVDGSKAPTVIEIADASTSSVVDLAAAIKEAKKLGTAASETPAVIVAPEGLYTPSTLPQSTVIITVGKPYAMITAADAGAALDSALDSLTGSGSSSAPSKVESKTVINVSAVGDSASIPAFASKIKGFLSNPELLTF